MLQELGTYLKLLLSNWSAGLFLILDAVAFVVGAIYPQLVLPTWVYWAIAGVVFLWANFGVYLDLSKELTTYKRPPGKKVVEPKLDIDLVDGNEYTYSLHHAADYLYWLKKLETAKVALQKAKEENAEREIGEYEAEIAEVTPELVKLEPLDHAPSSRIRLHIRISNVGAIGVDILAVEVRHESVKPWRFLGADIFDTNDEKVTFPKSLPPKALLLLDGVSIIAVEELGPARLAADLGNVTIESPHNVTARITVEAQSEAGQRVTINKEVNVASRPLKDIYLSHWQKKGLTDLLKLAQAGD